MKKIKWAIIGAGKIVDKRAIPGLLEDSNNEIVSIMDTSIDAAKSLSEKYSIPAYFDDEDKMLSSVECDAVYVATPIFCHYKQAMIVLKHNCHLFIEKPLAMTGEESEAIVDAFRKAKKQINVGYMMQHHNLHKKAKSIIKRGGIGQLVSARLQFSCWYPHIPGAWRQVKSLGGGGCIMDLAVHCMDLFSSITGESIKDVKAFYSTHTFDYEVEDSAAIIFKSDKGVLGYIDVNFNVADNATASKVEFYGTEGSLVAEGTIGQEEKGKLKYTYAPQEAYDAMHGQNFIKPKISYGKGGNLYTKQFSEFSKLILAEKTNYKNAKRAVEIQKICDRIYSEN